MWCGVLGFVGGAGVWLACRGNAGWRGEFGVLSGCGCSLLRVWGCVVGVGC